MKVIPFIYDDEDDLMANAYLLVDDSSCVVIDPSKNYDGVANFIKKNNLQLKAILLTHGHFDHMRGVDTLLNNFPSPLYIGFLDAPNLIDEKKNLSAYMNDEKVVIDTKPITVCESDTIKLLSEDIIVIDTPFHTEGSVCYYLKDSGILFSGDTLFKNSIGRDDLPGSISKEKGKSLQKLMALPEETKVYPGHGGFTTIGWEKKHNPFVN